MDEIMDTKVVQMKFDNSQFRKGVSETIKQLELLEDSLELSGASTGLDGVTKASKNTARAVSSISDATDDVQRHFSALEVIGITVMMRLTNAAMSYGSKIASGLWSKTLGQVISGGKARSQNIANAKFQLQGLGVAWDDIVEDINYGVQDTAYGLDEAARAASQLVASQVQLGDEMKTALRGISGVAAMTNSTFSEISDVWTTVASNGKLMTMQLRQLSARGLNASAQIAKYYKEVKGFADATEASINEMVSQGKIGFQDFAAAMDWAFGEHAKKANETFQGALSNVKSALSRIGQKFADPVYENLRKIFNGLIPVINNVNKAMDPIVKVFATIVDLAGDYLSTLLTVEDISRFLMQVLIDLYSYVRPVIEAFAEVFYKYIPLLDSSSRSLGDFAKKFMLTGENAEKVRDIFKSLFSIVDLFLKVGRSGFKILTTIVKGLLSTFKQLTGAMDPPLDILYRINNALSKLLDIAVNIIQAKLERAFERLAAALKLVNWEKVLNLVTKVTVVIVVAWELLLKLINLVISGVIKLIPYLDVAATILGSIVSAALYGIMAVGGLISNIFGRGRNLVTTIAVNARGLSNIPGLIRADDAVQSIDQSTGELNESMDQAVDEISELNDELEITEKNARRAGKSVDDLRKNTRELTKAAPDPRGRDRGQDGDDDISQNVADYMSARGMEAGARQHAQDMLNRHKAAPKNTRQLGFFETLASYFVADRNSGLLKVTKAIDDFFFGIYSYLQFAFGPLVDGIVEKITDFIDKKGGLKKALWSIITTISLIGGIILQLKILYSLIAAFDLIPSITYAIRNLSRAAVLSQVGPMLMGVAVVIGAIVAGMLAIAYASDKVNVVKLRGMLGAFNDALLEFVNGIGKTIIIGIAVVATVKSLGNILIGLSDTLRMIKGYAPRNTWTASAVSLIKSLTLFIGTMAASMYVLTTLASQDKGAWMRAIGSLLAMTILIGLIVTALVSLKYTADSADYTMRITLHGIERTGKSFYNGVEAIIASMALMIGIIVASIVVLTRVADHDKIMDAAAGVGLIMLAVLAFIGVLVWYCKLITPKWYQTMEGANEQMRFMAQAILNVRKVILALGFAMLSVAGALWIISKINWDNGDKALEAFSWLTGTIMAISLLLPFLINLMDEVGGEGTSNDILKATTAMASLIASMGIMMLMVAGAIKALEDTEITPSAMGTLIATLAIISVAAGAVAIFGRNWASLLTMGGVFLTVGGLFLMMGKMLSMIGDAVSAEQLHEITPLLLGLVGIMGVILALITIFGSIEVTAVPLIGSLLALSVVFATVGAIFASIGWAAKTIANAIEVLEQAIEKFTNIVWEDALEKAKKMKKYIKTINEAVKQINPLTIIGLMSFSAICKQIAKAIQSLDGIDTNQAQEAANALVVFIDSISASEESLKSVLKMAGYFAGIAWLGALAMAGIVVITGLLDATVILLSAFVIAMELYGSKIGPALTMFVQAIVDGIAILEKNAEILENGVWHLVQFAAGVFAAGGLLAAGSWFFVIATNYMAQAGANLVESFSTFLTAFITIGKIVEMNKEVIEAVAKTLLGFGVVAAIVGGLIFIVALEFFASCALFGLGIAFFGEAVYESSVYLNNALDQFNSFLDGLEELIERITGESFSIGYNFLQGFEDGWNSLCDSVENNIVGWFEDLIDSIKEELDEHSPSRKTHQIGEFLMEGFANGVKDGSPEAYSAVKTGVDLAMGVFDGLPKKGFAKGHEVSERFVAGMKTLPPDVGRNNNPYSDLVDSRTGEAAEHANTGGQNTTISYASGAQEAEPQAMSIFDTFVNGVKNILGFDGSGSGSGVINTFVNGFQNSTGISLNNIKNKVVSWWTTVGSWIGGSMEGGFSTFFDNMLRSIAKLKAEAQNNWSAVQRQAYEVAHGNSAAEIATYSGIVQSNWESEYRALRNKYGDLPTLFDPSSWNIDDILSGAGSSGIDYSGGDYTSDMASAISGSSGSGSGINDVSKGSAIGMGGSTVTNNNNTYNFYQTNYSPEPLDRSAIYQQTRNQFNSFYAYAKEKNLSY